MLDSQASWRHAPPESPTPARWLINTNAAALEFVLKSRWTVAQNAVPFCDLVFNGASHRRCRLIDRWRRALSAAGSDTATISEGNGRLSSLNIRTMLVLPTLPASPEGTNQHYKHCIV